MSKIPEEMKNFFNTRADVYDTQQIINIDGGKECYHEIEKYVPAYTKTLLDLGCGTGLELHSIFKKLPKVQVTGVDLADKMLKKLAEKYSKYSINLINDSYLTFDMGTQKYDTVISVMSFHHFTHIQKLKIYGNIFRCLRDNGTFIECDYMIGSDNAELETYYLSQRKKFESDYNPAGNLCHCDIPFTVSHEMSLLRESGFQSVEKV